MRKVFPSLYGNERIKQRVGDAILEGKLPHALLIDGGRGSGKLTLAKNIAAALNCEHKLDSSHTLPCHACHSCRSIFGDGHVDIHILELDGSRATIGVSEVKDLRRDMFLTSTEAEHKVYIIRDAEKMTPAAQNALLIVLEEPPENVTIMLLASGTDRILTTIKSRAQYLSMSRFGRDEMREHLLAVSDEARALDRSDRAALFGILNAADGRLGPAKELLDPARRAALSDERRETLAILESLGRSKSYRELLAATGALPTKRGELGESLERLMLAISDLIRHRHSPDAEPRFFISDDECELYGRDIATKKLFRLYDIVSEAHDANTKNANLTMLIATLSAEMRDA